MKCMDGISQHFLYIFLTVVTGIARCHPFEEHKDSMNSLRLIYIGVLFPFGRLLLLLLCP